MTEIDHEYTDEAVCPYCGYKYSDSWELSDEGTTECEECGKEFGFSREVSVSYSTKRVRCEPKQCKFKLKEIKYGPNPYIYKGKNWTIWQCKTCNHEILKTSNFIGNEPRIEYPTIEDYEQQ